MSFNLKIPFFFGFVILFVSCGVSQSLIFNDCIPMVLLNMFFAPYLAVRYWGLIRLKLYCFGINQVYIHLVFSLFGDTSSYNHCLDPLISYACKRMLLKSHHSLYFWKEKFPHIKHWLPGNTQFLYELRKGKING